MSWGVSNEDSLISILTLTLKCPGRESNPHAQKDTWPSTMPVYQFQHLGLCLVGLQK
jgi:hypothetical protein